MSPGFFKNTKVSSVLSSRIFDGIVVSLIIAFSIGFVMWTGHRGFYAFDQSIVFDGGYRVYLGQIIYKDFVIGVGPVVFWLQGFFFRIFGVNYTSYVLLAAIQNAVATLLVIFLIRRLFPGKKTASYLGGLITAVWFYAPMGTTYYDTTGALLVLFSVFLSTHCVISSLSANEPGSRPASKNAFLMLLSGVFLGLAFLTKQNIGALAAILSLSSLLILPVRPFSRRVSHALIAACGILLTMGVFLVWVWARSDVTTFVQHFFTIPSQQGTARIFDPLFFANKAFRVIFHYNVNAVASLLCLSIAVLSVFFDFMHKKQRGSSLLNHNAAVACMTAAMLIIYQQLNSGLTLNDLNLGYPFNGIIIMVVSLVAFELIGRGPNWEYDKGTLVRTIVATATLALFLTSFMYGVKISISRDVPLSYPATFNEPVGLERMKHLKWADPAYIPNTGVEVELEDFRALIRFLEIQEKPFFIFPDYTIAYGLCGSVPPQPVVWFHKGLTYPAQYSEEFDRRIVGKLRENMVETIVIENTSFFGTAVRLDDFPVLKSHIKNNFTKTDQIGIFEIWTLDE
jgi:hypothetical protein